MRANMDQHLSMVPQIKNVRLLLPLYLRLWAHVVQSDCHVFMKAFVWLTIYLSLGLPHFYMLRHFGKGSRKSCCSTSVTEYGVQYWVIGVDESICVWLLDNRGYILHFSFLLFTSFIFTDSWHSPYSCAINIIQCFIFAHSVVFYALTLLHLQFSDSFYLIMFH